MTGSAAAVSGCGTGLAGRSRAASFGLGSALMSRSGGETSCWTSPGGLGPGCGSGGADPVNVASGGPGGAADKFLRLTATNHMATYNLSQWAGNAIDQRRALNATQF